MERTLRIPRNMVRFFGTLSTFVEDAGLFDPLKDDTTREFEFERTQHLVVDQTMLDWFIRVYQAHYGYHMYLSRGEDDGRDKPITSLANDKELGLSMLLAMIAALEFYDAPLLLTHLILKSRTILRSYIPMRMKEFPMTSYVDIVLKDEVTRRKTILAELFDATGNQNLVEQLTERLWPALGPIIDAGIYHSMILTSDGLYAMDMNTGDPSTPSRVDLTHVVSTTSGQFYTMSITRDGLFGIGLNHEGEIGLEDDYYYMQPVRVYLENVLSVASKYSHTLILTSEGLFGCGNNLYNQLGIEGHPIRTPTRLPFENVLSMACGKNCTMVLTCDGLYACGENYNGQFGIGHDMPKTSPVRVPIENVIAVSCGAYHSMILTRDGLFACGNNFRGQLGLGDKKDRHVPTRVPLENVIAVACGADHTMILTGDGLLGCGLNDNGQLGLGDRNSRVIPERVNIENVLAISCGHFYTMILTTDGLFVAGHTEFRRLGSGEEFGRPLPTKVPLRIGHEQAMLEQVREEEGEDRMTKKRRLGALLCTRCNKVGSFLDPLQKRYLFCSDRCYKDFFHT